MPEQRRVRKKRTGQLSKNLPPGADTMIGASTEDNEAEETRERMKNLEAAMNNILGSLSSNAAIQGSSTVIGEQKSHKVRPLSDEKLLKSFKQEEGE